MDQAPALASRNLGAPDGIRTRTTAILSRLPLPVGLRGHGKPRGSRAWRGGGRRRRRPGRWRRRRHRRVRRRGALGSSVPLPAATPWAGCRARRCRARRPAMPSGAAPGSWGAARGGHRRGRLRLRRAASGLARAHVRWPVRDHLLLLTACHRCTHREQARSEDDADSGGSPAIVVRTMRPTLRRTSSRVWSVEHSRTSRSPHHRGDTSPPCRRHLALPRRHIGVLPRDRHGHVIHPLSHEGRPASPNTRIPNPLAPE